MKKQSLRDHVIVFNDHDNHLETPKIVCYSPLNGRGNTKAKTKKENAKTKQYVVAQIGRAHV